MFATLAQNQTNIGLTPIAWRGTYLIIYHIFIYFKVRIDSAIPISK